MIKSIGKLTLATILAALVVGVPLAATAQTTTPAAPATGKPHATAFRTTTITSVDKAAKVITLGDKAKHALQVTADSKFTLDKKAATFDDIAVGQHATGSYYKGADGKLTLRTLHASTAAPAK